jgi:predicted RNA binding protein YcfA (HicA-like mRNA interferase family)
MPDSIKTIKVLKTLKKMGFEKIRQKGDHLFLKHPDGRTTTLPLHKEIRIKLLTKIIKKDLKISKENFLYLLD